MSLTPHRSLVDEEWFHGVLPREEVVRLLRQEGDFLVRETTRNDECQTVLSVCWGGHKHFIVQTTAEVSLFNYIKFYIYIYIYTHTHTHLHTYIYTHILYGEYLFVSVSSFRVDVMMTGIEQNYKVRHVLTAHTLIVHHNCVQTLLILNEMLSFSVF